MPQNNSDQGIISRAKIVKGIKLFIALSAIGILIVLYRSSLSESFSSLRDFKLPQLALIVFLVLFDWFMAGLRIHLFASHVHPGISFGGCIRANLANVFMGGVTPSQTGGGAGQIYILYKEGMGVMDATVVSFLGFLNTVVFLPISGLLITFLLKSRIENVALRMFSMTTILAFSVILIAVILSLIDPKLFESCVRSMLRIIPFLKRIVESKAYHKFLETLTRYHALMLHFIKRGKLIIAIGFFLTIIMYFNKFAVAYVVLSGLGIQVDFWQVIYLQLLLILVFYFSPTPGSSGFAELSSALIMGQIIPKSSVGIFVLLWRFFTLFLGMLIGAYVLLKYMLKSDRVEAAAQADFDVKTTTK